MTGAPSVWPPPRSLSSARIRVLAALRRFGSSGYVVETAPLALFLARRMTEETFATGLAELVEAGGDTAPSDRSPGRWGGRILGFPACLGISAHWRRFRRATPRLLLPEGQRAVPEEIGGIPVGNAHPHGDWNFQAGRRSIPAAIGNFEWGIAQSPWGLAESL
jgi:hypothetical protein